MIESLFLALDNQKKLLKFCLHLCSLSNIFYQYVGVGFCTFKNVHLLLQSEHLSKGHC